MEHSSWEPSLPTRGPVRLKRQAVSSQHAVVGQAWGDSYRHPSVRRGGVGDKTESLVHAAWKSSSANPINFRGTVLPSVILGSDLWARCWEKASQKCLSNDVSSPGGWRSLASASSPDVTGVRLRDPAELQWAGGQPLGMFALAARPGDRPVGGKKDLAQMMHFW